LSEYILSLIVEKPFHRHQLGINLLVRAPRRKRPGNERAVSHVSNLNVVVVQKARSHLTNEAMHRTDTVLYAPTLAQLANEMSCGNRACAQLAKLNLPCRTAVTSQAALTIYLGRMLSA